MGEKLRFDPEDMTVGDLEDFEEVTGRPLSEVFKGGEAAFDAKVIKAMVWIAFRRDDPEFSLDDARNVKVSEIDIAPSAPAASANGGRPTKAAGSKS